MLEPSPLNDLLVHLGDAKEAAESDGLALGTLDPVNEPRNGDEPEAGEKKRSQEGKRHRAADLFSAWTTRLERRSARRRHFRNAWSARSSG